MTKRADQLHRIEEAGKRVEAALAALGGIADVAAKVGLLGGQVAGLAEIVQQMMAARGEHDAAVAADAKRAATAAEAAFAGVQSLATVATAKPGLDELAAAVQATGEAVQQLHQAVAVPAVAPDPGPASRPGTGKAKP